MAAKISKGHRKTVKNPGGAETGYRVLLESMGNIRIENQLGFGVVYGGLVDMLGRYEDLGTVEELKELKDLVRQRGIKK